MAERASLRERLAFRDPPGKPSPEIWPPELLESGSTQIFESGLFLAKHPAFPRHVNTRGSAAESIRLVTKGFALSICQNPSDDPTAEEPEDYVAYVYGPGEILSPLSAQGTWPRYEDTVVTTHAGDLQTRTFTRDQFDRHLSATPATQRLLMEQIYMQRVNIAEQAALVTKRNVPAKIDIVLANLARRFGRQVTGTRIKVIDHPFTRGEIARMVGTTTETVCRRITKLVKQGILERKTDNGLIIQEPDRLGV